MLRRLLLVVHAETDATRASSFAEGEGLNVAGLDPSRVSEALRHGLDALPGGAGTLTSPARAARETAALLHLDATDDQALRDLDMGEWRGKSLADVASREGEALARWVADPGWAGHGGESIDQLIARMADWLVDRRAIGGVAVAITHASVVRAALVAALEAPSSAFWRIDVPPLAFLVLGTDGRRWTLRSLSTS